MASPFCGHWSHEKPFLLIKEEGEGKQLGFSLPLYFQNTSQRLPLGELYKKLLDTENLRTEPAEVTCLEDPEQSRGRAGNESECKQAQHQCQYPTLISIHWKARV